MNPYDRWVLPTMIDKACGIGPVQQHRARLVPQARGRVLEIGIGTGHNLPFYDTSAVTEVVAVDPAQQMHAKAQRRAHEAGLDLQVLPLSAERLPLDTGSVDTVVCTFTLCSIPDPVPAVAEMKRVLAEGGQLIVCEHGRAPDASVRAWQRRLNPVWGALAGGCHLDRDVPALLGAFDAFDTGGLEVAYIQGPRFAGYVYSGVLGG
ncbi:class I SAM-dependent methyltransferase [Nocardioides montaniterrae]